LLHQPREAREGQRERDGAPERDGAAPRARVLEEVRDREGSGLKRAAGQNRPPTPMLAPSRVGVRTGTTYSRSRLLRKYQAESAPVTEASVIATAIDAWPIAFASG